MPNKPPIIEQPSRRHFLRLVGLATPLWVGGVVGSALLTACTSLPAGGLLRAPAPPTPLALDETTSDEGELIFWGDANHPIDHAAAGFVAAYPAVTWLSPHPRNRAAKLQAALAANEGVPDLYWATAVEAQALGCQAQLTDLTPYLEPIAAHYHPAKLAECWSAQTEQYIGWPGDLGICGWYYRADLLEKVGWQESALATLTWPAFFGLAATLRSQGLYPYRFPAQGWPFLFFMCLHQVGGTALDQTGEKITVGSDEGIAAMRLVKQLWEAGGGLDAADGGSAYKSALQTGTLVGDFAPAWASATGSGLLAESPAGGRGQWRVAPLPMGAEILHRTALWGGGQLILPKAAANPTRALHFMHYTLASITGATRYGVDGLVPAYRPYFQAAACQAQRLPLFGAWPVCSFWASQAAELSSTYYQPAGWGAVAAAVQQEMMAIVQDAYAIEDGLSRIVERALPAFSLSQCQ
ncbi:MAG: extracellular solute-binding protein [Caldilineaceae bacterium]|nr:extracellular solute-binding protein [Caldilineaceae bacterium]